MRLLLVIFLLLSGCSSDPDSERLGDFLNEQLLLFATIVGSIAALPTLIDYMVERRKRKERLSLSIEEVVVATLKPRLAGMDELLSSIDDLIDRARHPRDYAKLEVGNEILIVGPKLSGKQTLAHVIAKRAGIERLITVYNPRNADALAKAKSLMSSDRSTRKMLLLPRIDQVFEKEDEEVLTELEALIETSSEQSNVLVIGTAVEVIPNSTLDNLFGIKLVLPGGLASSHAPEPPSPEMRRVLSEVTRFYLAEAKKEGFALDQMDEEEFVRRILVVASNAAEVEDIIALCQTAALYHRRIKRQPALSITPQMLETAISRVITCPPSGTVEWPTESPPGS